MVRLALSKTGAVTDTWVALGLSFIVETGGLSKTGAVTDNLAALVLSFVVKTGCLVGLALPGTDNRAALAGFDTNGPTSACVDLSTIRLDGFFLFR